VERIRKRPGVSFNELAKVLDIESGLLAFHVGVLKSANLVDVDYGRAGKNLSAYTLSARGEKAYSSLLSAVGAAMNQNEKSESPSKATEARRNPRRRPEPSRREGQGLRGLGRFPQAPSSSVHVRAYVRTAKRSRRRTSRKK
jgi:hypothetical protein